MKVDISLEQDGKFLIFLLPLAHKNPEAHAQVEDEEFLMEAFQYSSNRASAS